MATVTLKCSCCNESYEVEVHDTCSRSCGATMRERRRAARSKPRTVPSARDFLRIAQPRGSHLHE
jgi:hypothetical protein